MKRLILMSALFLGMLPLMSAQEANMEKEVTSEDYERMLENQLKVDFRSKAYKSMALTEDQIIAFDPLFMEYTQKKQALLSQKFDLIDAYKKEMSEADGAQDEEAETAGFIENYWELDIQEMELKKDYFDRFEDVASIDQTINFFMLEKSMQDDMERPSMIRIVPMIIEFERMPGDYNKDKDGQNKWEKPNKEGMNKEGINDSSMNIDGKRDNTQSWTDEKITATEGKPEQAQDRTTWTEKEKMDRQTEMNRNKSATLENRDNWTEKSPTATTSTNSATTADDKVMAYGKWVKDAKGGVALDHQYTHDGIIHLANAVSSIATMNNMDVSAWDTQKDELKKMAETLQVDPLSTDHADIAKEAFVMIADMIETVQTKTNNNNTKAIAQSVVTAANAIDPDELLTRQANKIYTFFEQANDAVSKLSTSAKASAAYNDQKQ